MRFSVLIFHLLLFYFTVHAVACYNLLQQQQQQQPLFGIKKESQSLKLKSIYHKASYNAPIPHLFRRYDVKEEEAAIFEAEMDNEMSIQGHLAIIDKPSDTDISRLLESRKRSALGLARWSNVVEEQSSNGRNNYQNVQAAMNMQSAIEFVPDVTDRKTVLTLAMMTNNAYLDISLNDTDWYDIEEPWKLNNSFGWKENGLRGHIFTNDDDSLVVISIKGTSAGLWTGGPTGEKDKINDNMLFSCCCARISRAWTPVCDCYQGNGYICENSCLQKNIQESELYYDSAMVMVEEVIHRFKKSTIWITGHSLGGALASLVGQTFGIPTVTFEIPGDKLASTRLHLPSGVYNNRALWHFGHTADPIFVGVCTGPSSSCWYGGYAMESRCHTGKKCVWDTVKDNGWRVDIRSHRVKDVIENILKKKEEFPLPNCVYEEEDCQDCGLWSYYDKRDPISSTTTLSSTQSATTTCKSSSSIPSDRSSSTSTKTTVIGEPITDDPWGHWTTTYY